MRFLTTSQLARLGFGGSRWAANKRLRKLLDGGLVRVWVRDLARDNVYSLTRRGAAHLASEEEAAWPVPRGLDGNLDHLLAINEVRISLALGLAETGGEIRCWRSDWELRALARGRIVPDALFALGWVGTGHFQTFALEIDNATRSARRFLGKLLKYASLRVRGRDLYGVRDFILLIVGRDERWVERYRQALANLRLGLAVSFATLPGVGREGAAGSIWRPAGGEERHSLQDLASLPYGKEGRTPESLDSYGT
ncbi:MAG: replication-relaxation family protein [Candidatus Rokuibacteriota bacterium]